MNEEGWGGYFYRKRPYKVSTHGRTLLFDEGEAFAVERLEKTSGLDFHDDLSLVTEEYLADVLLASLAPGHSTYELYRWYGPYGPAEGLQLQPEGKG